MDSSTCFDTANSFALDDNITDFFSDFDHITADLFGHGDFMNFTPDQDHVPDQDPFSDIGQKDQGVTEEDQAPVQNPPARANAIASLSDEARRTSLPSPDPSSRDNSPLETGVKSNTQGPCTTTSSGVKQSTAIALSPNIAKRASTATHSPEPLQRQRHLPQKKFTTLEAQMALLEDENRALAKKIKELESITTQVVRSFNAYKVEQVQFIQNSIPVHVQNFLQLHLQNMQQAFAELKKPPLVAESLPRMLPPQGNFTSQVQASPSLAGPSQVPKPSPKRRKTNNENASFASALPTPQCRNNIGIRSTPINPPSTQSSLEDADYPLVSDQIANTNISVSNSENISAITTPRLTNSVSGDPFERLIKASIDLNARTKRAFAEYNNNPPADVVTMFEKERRDMWNSLPPEQQKQLQERVLEFQASNCTPSSQFSSRNPFARMALQNKTLQPSSAPIAPMIHQPSILPSGENGAPFATAGGVFGVGGQLDIGVQNSSQDFQMLDSQLPGGVQSFLSQTPTFNPHHNMLPQSMMPTTQKPQFHHMMQEPNFPQIPLYNQFSPYQQNVGSLQSYEQQLNARQQMPSMLSYRQNSFHEVPPQMTPQRSLAMVPSTPTRTSPAVIGRATPAQSRKLAPNKKGKGH